jgi:hypothetical protein
MVEKKGDSVSQRHSRLLSDELINARISSSQRMPRRWKYEECMRWKEESAPEGLGLYFLFIIDLYCFFYCDFLWFLWFVGLWVCGLWFLWFVVCGLWVCIFLL